MLNGFVVVLRRSLGDTISVVRFFCLSMKEDGKTDDNKQIKTVFFRLLRYKNVILLNNSIMSINDTAIDNFEHEEPKTKDYVRRAKTKYYQNRLKTNDEFMERHRERARNNYEKNKNDADFIERRKLAQRKYYYKKKNEKDENTLLQKKEKDENTLSQKKINNNNT